MSRTELPNFKKTEDAGGICDPTIMTSPLLLAKKEKMVTAKHPDRKVTQG
jgi:hypothetical protein